MKIVKETSETYSVKVVNVESALYIGNYKISITFDDGVETIVDFGEFLNNSLHTGIRKFLNEKLFKSFDIINGNLNWNDYDMIFPIHDLYSGVIQ